VARDSGLLAVTVSGAVTEASAPVIATAVIVTAATGGAMTTAAETESVTVAVRAVHGVRGEVTVGREVVIAAVQQAVLLVLVVLVSSSRSTAMGTLLLALLLSLSCLCNDRVIGAARALLLLWSL
jgi:hypothetical protein